MAKALLIVPFIFICFLGHAQQRAFTVTVTGKGQPIILIPGYSCSADVWKETVAHLAGKYECHVINIAGYAGVAPIEAPVLETVKNELVKYIEEKKLKDVVMIGHSLGGFMSLWVAAYLPGRIGKVVVVDGVPAISAMTDPFINYDSLKKSPVYDMDVVINNFKALPDSGYIDQAARAMLWQVNDTARARQIAAWSFRSDRATLGTTLVEISLTDLRPLLSKISCPVLVMPSLYGTEEGSMHIMNQQYANLQRKEVRVATSKHFIMYDVPDWMYAQIDSFLAK